MEPTLPQWTRFDRTICDHLDAAEQHEWWLANGLGGYAAGPVTGTLTRRYHGLLVAPPETPLGRSLVFARADATLVADGQCHRLHSGRWAGGATAPRGHLHLETFHLDGRLPVWRYVIGDLRLEARIWLEADANTTYLAWRLLTQRGEDDAPRLAVRLLVSMPLLPKQTSVGHCAPAIDGDQSELRVAPAEGALLRFRSRCGRFRPERTWTERFEPPAGRERVLPDADNHLYVGQLDLPLYSGEWVGCVASLEDDPSPYVGEALRERRRRDAGLLRMTHVRASALAKAPAWIDQLVLAADGFLVRHRGPNGARGVSVIAGYPWPIDWGPDTFLALPGLTLATGRQERAREILESWIGHLEAGLLSNHSPELTTPPAQVSADAALWFIDAWRAFAAVSSDLDVLRRHFPALTSILSAFAKGAYHGIERDPTDGLLWADNKETQPNGIDARVDGRPVTPRAGKPVELSALWYNALMGLATLARQLGVEPAPWSTLAAQTREGFRRFIRADGAGLYGMLDGPEGEETRVRPNQILAVSLAYSPLDPPDQAAVVRVVGAQMAASHGLRTASPADPIRDRHCGGDALSGDTASRPGPAWAWLVPHYTLALHRVTGDAAAAQSLLETLADHRSNGGLGRLNEPFDTALPHGPLGAPSQAWSVACTLDAWCRLEQAKAARSRD